MKNIHNERGFTIVELMIATLVFSAILLVATVGILNIGRLYRKSLIQSQTQQSARSAIDTITQNIKFNGGNFTAGSGSGVYCLGNNKRISFRTNTQFISPNTHGLVIDDISCNSSTTSQDLSQANILGKELLGPNMRLANFYICAKGMSPDAVNCTSSIINGLQNGSYYVFLRVVYGSDDLLTADRQGCNLNAGREFCAVSEISTYVQKVL